MDHSFDDDASNHRRRTAFSRWGARPVRQIARTSSAEIWLVSTSAGPSVVKIWPNGPGNELVGARLSNATREAAVLASRIAKFAYALKVAPQRLTQWAAAKCALFIVWRANGPLRQDAEADPLARLLVMAKKP
jgi:streptomycin 6-kinase